MTGYSCRLLTKDMPLMILNAHSLDETRSQISRAISEFGPSLKKSNNVGLIIDGHVGQGYFTRKLMSSY